MWSYCVIGIAFNVLRWKSSRDLFHNDVNVLTLPNCTPNKGLDRKFYVLYFLPQFFKKTTHGIHSLGGDGEINFW